MAVHVNKTMTTASRALLKAILVLLGVVAGVIALERKDSRLESTESAVAKAMSRLDDRISAIESNLNTLSETQAKAVAQGIKLEITRTQNAEPWDFISNSLSRLDARTILITRSFSQD